MWSIRDRSESNILLHNQKRTGVLRHYIGPFINNAPLFNKALQHCLWADATQSVPRFTIQNQDNLNITVNYNKTKQQSNNNMDIKFSPTKFGWWYGCAQGWGRGRGGCCELKANRLHQHGHWWTNELPRSIRPKANTTHTHTYAYIHMCVFGPHGRMYGCVGVCLCITVLVHYNITIINQVRKVHTQWI